MQLFNRIINNKVDSKGYALVELLAVLVILGIISVIMVLSMDK